MARAQRGKTNLAHEPSSFVGRAPELATLEALFDEARLVTVLGPGGIGKTRLSMRFARGQVARHSARRGGGIWFADLGAARDPSGALAVVAGVLGIELEGLPDDEKIAERIGARLSRLGHVLLVLDNFEHVASLASVVASWLRRAPSARLLVTSRVVLAIDGEQVLLLGPLEREEATALFLERARLVRPDDAAADPGLIGGIVDAIDRMPLAIELAASQTRVLSFSELLRRLGRPLELLQRVDPDARHGSIRRAILDSVDLLSPPARRLFALTSVLRNGFTVEDVESILDGAGVLPRGEVLRGLDELARTSLLRVEARPDGPTRLAYFETIRDVAEELAAADPARLEVLRALVRRYVAVATSLGPRVDLELDNVLVAHETAVGFAEAEHRPEYARDATSLAVGLDPLLSSRGLSRLRARLFERTLAAIERTGCLDRDAQASAHLGLGLAARELGDTQVARTRFEAAHAIASAAGLDALCAVALTRLGSVHDLGGDTRGALAHLAEAMSLLARTSDDAQRWASEAEAQLLIGHAQRREGALDAASVAASRAAERYRALEDDEGLAAALYELGVIDMFAGRAEAAFARFDEGLAVARRGGIRVMEGGLTTARGCLLQDAGRLDAALAHHAEAARIFGDLGSRLREASALYYLATTHLEQGDPAEALAVLAQSRRCARAAGAPRYDALIAGCASTALAMLGRLGEAEAELGKAEAALAQVAREPSLAAAIAVHRMGLEVRAGRREGQAALAAAAQLVRDHPNDDARFSLRALGAIVRGDGQPAARKALVLSADASTFLAPTASARVQLPVGSALCRILDHLARRRVDAPARSSP